MFSWRRRESQGGIILPSFAFVHVGEEDQALGGHERQPLMGLTSQGERVDEHRLQHRRKNCL
jgi:hypothetical protein